MRATLLFSILVGLFVSTEVVAKPHEKPLAKHGSKTQKKKPVVNKKLVRCLPSKGKGKLAKNHCKRPKFKVITEGHVLASSVTGGVFLYPQGWLNMKSAHSGESVCVNIFSGENCDPRWSIAQLLASSKPTTQPFPPESTLPSQDSSLNPQPPDEIPSTTGEPAQLLPGPITAHLDSNLEEKPAASGELAMVESMEQPTVQPTLNTQETTAREEEDTSAVIAMVEGEGGASEGEGGGEGDIVSKVDGLVTDPYTQDKLVDLDIHIHPYAQAAIDAVFRDRRTGHKKNVNPRLIVKLSSLCEHFKRQILLVSGYRNQKHTTSRHYGARASDIQIPGIPIEEIRTFAQMGNKRAIGIGLYPKGGFIHLDARDAPSYAWIQHVVPIRRGKLSGKGLHRRHGTQGKAVAVKSTSSSKRHS